MCDESTNPSNGWRSPEPTRPAGRFSDPAEACQPWQDDEAESVPGFHVPIMAEDLDGLSDAGRDGFDAFWSGVALHRNPHDEGIERHNWTQGWHMAYARCFAVGAVQGHVDRLRDREGDNPYPQFSTAWEAWAAGHDTAGLIGEVLR